MGYSQPATVKMASISRHSHLESLAALMGSRHSSRSAGAGHVQDMEKWYFLNADTHVCFSPSVPYFSGLVLRTTPCSDIGMFSGSLNLQTCTWLGNDAWKTSWLNARSWVQWGGLGCQKQGGDLQSRTLARHSWEHQESSSVPISEQTLLLLPLTQSQGKGANPCMRAELQLLTGG